MRSGPRWCVRVLACVALLGGTVLGVAVLGVAVLGGMPAPAFADDARPGDAWQVAALHLTDAHAVSRGAGVTVALLTGPIAAHKDLRGALLPPIDVRGGQPTDPTIDGTGAAGLIVGRGNGRTGLVGVAPRAVLLPVTVGGRGDDAADVFAKGIDAAVAAGARVVAVPYVWSSTGAELQRAVRDAVAADVVVVAPASRLSPLLPSIATLPGVVSVAPTDRSGHPAERTVSGLDIDVAAPGEDVVTTTTVPPDGYRSGRNHAYPVSIVAGTAALIRSRHAELSAADVSRRLALTGRTGHDLSLGRGVVDPLRALKDPLPELPAASVPGTRQDDQWYLDALRVPDAHRLSRGAGVTIGLVANGVDLTHPSLAGHAEQPVWINRDGRPDTGPRTASDFDTADLKGWTGVAAMAVGGSTSTGAGISTSGGTGTGVLGVAPEAGLQVVPTTFRGSASGIGPAARWLVDHGTTVLLLPAEKLDAEAVDAVRYALAHDVVVIQGAHERATVVPGLLTVGAVGEDGERESWDHAPVALLAPGKNLMVAGAGGKRASSAISGPDTAAGYVAGVAALIRARQPTLSAASVINRMIVTASPEDAEPAQLVDPLNAVLADVPAVTANPLGDPGPPSAPAASGRSWWLIAGLGALVLVALAGALLVLVLVVRRRVVRR
jgi:membrane-anchored mycosin MYCP